MVIRSSDVLSPDVTQLLLNRSERPRAVTIESQYDTPAIDISDPEPVEAQA